MLTRTGPPETLRLDCESSAPPLQVKSEWLFGSGHLARRQCSDETEPAWFRVVALHPAFSQEVCQLVTPSDLDQEWQSVAVYSSHQIHPSKVEPM